MEVEREISIEISDSFFFGLCVANEKDSQINLSLLSKRFYFKNCILSPQIYRIHNSFQNSTFWIVLNESCSSIESFGSWWNGILCFRLIDSFIVRVFGGFEFCDLSHLDLFSIAEILVKVAILLTHL